MAVIDLPGFNVQKCWFDYVENVAKSTSGAGTFINLSNVMDETWRAEIQSGLLDTVEKIAGWSVFRKSLKGGLNLFATYDRKRALPVAYQTAKASTDISAGWNGTGLLWSWSASSLGVENVPPGYQFTAGDRVSIEQGTNISYHELLTTVGADENGQSNGLAIAPFIPSIFTTGAVVRLWRPRCQFVIDWSSWSEDGGREATAISFNAYQRIIGA